MKVRGWRKCAGILAAAQFEDVKVTANGETVSGFLLNSDMETVRMELDNGYGWTCDARDVTAVETSWHDLVEDEAAAG